MMKDKNIHFLLYASCIPISGYKQTAIYDINQEIVNILPNGLFNFIAKSKDTDVKTLKKKFQNKYDIEIDDLFNYLISKNIGFYTYTPQCFPKMSLLWETPHLVTNMVLDISENSVIEYNICNQIEESGCEALQIRFLYNIEISNIKKIIHHFHNSRLRSIEIILLYNPAYGLKKYREVLHFDARIVSVCVCSSPFEKSTTYKRAQKTLIFSSNDIFGNNCGKISSYYFKINTSLFTESHHYNTCLNRKLCIDADGNIKNCPAMQQNFGNIKDTTLQEAIEKNGFKDFWLIHKDKIDVCKDCEFRHMCTDCRCFIKDPENIYSQPAKCIYNPYICKWQGEEGYVPVEECGTYSKETGFVPDAVKIAELNKQIWE